MELVNEEWTKEQIEQKIWEVRGRIFTSENNLIHLQEKYKIEKDYLIEDKAILTELERKLGERNV